MVRISWTLAALLAAMTLLAALYAGTHAATPMQRCLFVSSYHKGYAWSDGVERGVRSVLEGKCQIRQFDMDTKRRKSAEEKKQAALEAKALIETWEPDIVIAADDNAAKYLIQPYYKDHSLPFVFCGVNWTADEYGFPYSNVTGMIEIAPIVPMLERARQVIPDLRRAFYIGAKTLTEQKNLERFEAAARTLGFALDFKLVPTTEAWLEAFREAQEADLIIVGSKGGIDDWDSERIRRGVIELSRTLSVTNHEWMMPYTMVGVTKVPEEHGEWAAKAALRILQGMSPSQIPIVSNNRRDIWVNHEILDAAGVSLPEGLMRRGKRVAHLGPNQ